MLNRLLPRGNGSGNKHHQQLCIQREMYGRFTGERYKTLGVLLQVATSREARRPPGSIVTQPADRPIHAELSRSENFEDDLT